MARFIVALLFFIIGSADAQAQNNWEYLSKTPERLIGLLDLPEIVAGGCGPATNRATARAFATPSQNGPSIGTIYWHEERDVVCGLMIEKAGGSKEELPTLESGYEIPAAIVYERRGAWFRIRLQDGSAWIRRGNQKEFLAYPEVLHKGPHTLQSRDGTLRATPGRSGRVVPPSPGWKALLDRQLTIQFLGFRRVGNDLWLHIRLAAKPLGCGQTYEGVTDAEGWIPAYHVDRTPSAWFSSRGC